jgi:anti-sigma factor RsiW
MNHEFELKLQAYLDGELDAAQAREVQTQLQTIPEARALLAELQGTTTALRGNEPEYKLPETREFYWSKIERAIDAPERVHQAMGSRFKLTWLWRYWPQLSGAVAAAMLLTIGLFRFGANGAWSDIENPLSDTSTFTFRSEQARVTLVWVSNNTQEEDEGFEGFN